MTREQAVKEIKKAFEPAFANYIIIALTEGATVSDIQHRWGRAYEAEVKDGLEQQPMVEIDLYSVIKQKYIERDVIDKIIADIIDEKDFAYADFDRYKEEVLGAESDELPDDDFRYGMERAIEIIYKHKTESEGEE